MTLTEKVAQLSQTVAGYRCYQRNGDEFLFSDDFIEFIKNYNCQSRPKVMELLDKYSHKDIYIFKTRNEADEFLNQL